jgi:hypothetical protein
VTPELPDTVQGRNARPVLDDFIHVYAVRLGAADSRPVMYSCRWAAKRIGVSPKTVHRMLAYLVEVGALMPHGAMPGRGTRGTGLFLPSTGAAGGG